MMRIIVPITSAQVRSAPHAKMHTKEAWEEDLDIITDAIRAGMHQHRSTARDGDIHVDARSIMRWFGALVELLGRLKRENDPDGLSEVLDVLTLLLKACADGQWRQLLQENLSLETDWFSKARLRVILDALEVICEHNDCGETYELVTDSVASLLFVAASDHDVEAVLEGLRRLPKTGAMRATLFKDVHRREHGTWNERFVRFVVWFISMKVRKLETPNGIITALTGIGEREWMQHFWETKWHLHHSPSIERSLFGSIEQCVASLRRLFDGFSIPSIEPTASESLSEAAAVMNLRYGNDQFGLRHGVDVTFIRQGRVHPEWADASNRDHNVQVADADDALKDGYTIGIRGMQARSLPLFALSESLQEKLGQHVNANLYWTPPDERGFDIHVDDHCVFVLQLKGSKRWFLYKPLETLPNLYEETTAALKGASPPLDQELLLTKGDILYVPRGVAHHADTSGMRNESIHLTIGVEIEEAHTTGRVLQELDETRHNDEQWSLKLASRIKNQGLMAWHLESPDAFREYVFASVGLNVFELTEESREALEKIRVRLLQERQCFLRSRSTSARGMATLHASMANDDAWLEATDIPFASADQTADGEGRPSKRSRQH